MDVLFQLPVEPSCEEEEEEEEPQMISLSEETEDFDAEIGVTLTHLLSLCYDISFNLYSIISEYCCHLIFRIILHPMYL